MRWRSAPALWRPASVALVVALLASFGPGVGAEDGVAPEPGDSAAAVETHTVGLITGDTVSVHEFDGRRGVDVELVDRGGYKASYDVLDEDGRLYVIPSDVLALIPDTLDRELFNVTKLIDYGYDVEHGLPVIVVPPEAPGELRVAGPLRLESAPGVGEGTPLASVGGVAATVDGGNPAFWRALTDPRGELAARTTTGPLAEVGKVWLDEQVEATLDVSAPMVGAPAARAAGYDGTGLTVAVLDTGIDVTHPDFTGRIAGAETFLPTGTAVDGHGHGTHVAGIIAGSGAASGGTYAGMAPGAELLSGKVLGDNGSGQTSWIIQGMEWAAEAGADVVNMSLGSSSPSNGFDLLSSAVNRLTEEHDVLFVTSAGNLGPGGWTISSPGAASSALTVGAVDSSGNLAGFSSRGPRLVPALRHLIGGEFSIKPDITAPGVRIASTRAGGTSLGTPVDAHYTRASGTSMAAPHVAGAAAIVLQQRPELGAAGLKSALVTSAAPHDGLAVYQQGGGLLDIPAALDAPVATSPAPLDFGSFEFPYDDTAPVSTEVTYTNTRDEAITLDLSFDVTSPEAGAPGAAVLQVAPERLDLAVGESAEVTVTLDPRAGEFGTYGGALLATGSGGSVVSRIPTGFWLEPPTYTLTIEGIDRRGNPADGPHSMVDVIDVHDLNTFTETHFFFNRGGTVSVEVPHGTYAVVGRFQDPHPEHGEELSIVSVPELPVTGDRTVVLDARTANQVTLDTPQHDTSPLPHSDVTVGFQRGTAAGQHFARAFTAPATAPVYLAEAEPPALGDFSVFSRRLLGTADGTVLYDLVLVEPDGIPDDLHYVADTGELAAVTNRYHSDLPNQVVQSTRFVELPGWEGLELGVTHAFNAPSERTDYYLGGQGAHRQRVNLNGATLPTLFTEPVTYTAGERLRQSWFARPMAPGLRADEPTVRTWNTLRVAVSPWVDSGGNAMEAREGPTEYSFFQDGELVASGTNPSVLSLSNEPAEYRLELRAETNRSWWQTSTAASTAWTWRSGPPADGGPEVVPLLQVDYDIDLDLSNTAVPPEDRTGPPVMELQVGHQAGADGAPIAGARLWTSYDDGASWRQRPGNALGDGRYEFVLDSRDGELASLKVEAWDAGGNRVEQEIIDAFRLPTHLPPDPEPPGTTERVSVATDGTQANRNAAAPPAITADGRYVAWSSTATTLVPGDPTVPGGVFVRDRATGTTERVSVASDGTPATGNAPAITPDGRYVAFASSADTLVPGDTNNWQDVFVHDRETGVTERVSVASDGTEGNAGSTSTPPVISADGRYVAFASNASNLVPDDTNSTQDVFVHDRETGTTERVSVASDGTQTPQFFSSSNPAISGDGRLVAFQSSASNLVTDDTNDTADIFVHDRETGVTERVSVASDGSETERFGFSSNPAISADGRHVAFQSSASTLAPGDTNNMSDVFVHDRETGSTERMSLASDGTQGDGFSGGPAISADGRYVGFPSGATTLVPGDTNGVWDAFVHDQEAGVTERVSVASAGTEANQTSGSTPALSADGRHVAFVSSASNLVPGDTNGQSDVFVRTRSGE
jgi:subtilisin family serine protease/Tol biopolymer transport system component